MASSVDILSLGGCGGFGMNATLFAAGDRAMLVDFGIGFPRDVLPGAARLVPDPTPLLERWPRLEGIVLTHAHDDHAGAVGYLPDAWAGAPIFGRPLTLTVARERWDEGRTGRPDLREMHPGAPVQLGPFTVTPIHVTHSIPESSALRIDGPCGTIVHSGDFKLDPDPWQGPLTDIDALRRAAADGVALLMIDSTGAVVEHPSRSERSAVEALERVVAQAPGQVIVGTFSTQLDRVDALCGIAQRQGRRVALIGRRLQSMSRHGMAMGYLRPASGLLVGPAGLELAAPGERLVIASGCQGEPESALGRLSLGAHRSLDIGEGDLVVLAARTIPGNEIAVARLVDRFLRRGAEVLTTAERPEIHASGHGTGPDLARLIDLTRPQALVPIHGDRRHLARAAGLAAERPDPPRRIEIVERGEWLHLGEDGLRRGETVDLPPRLLDEAGRSIGFESMRERRRAAAAGSAVLLVQRGSRPERARVVLEGIGLAVRPEAIQPEIQAEVRRLLADDGAEEDLCDAISRRVARRLAGGRSLPRPLVRVVLDGADGSSR
jgi:ribonuclease J